MSLKVLTEMLDSLTAIEEMLRKICGGVSIDHATGEVTMVGPLHGDATDGCDCIRALISSKRQVTIHPLSSPTDEVSDPNLPPGQPKNKIGKCGGGATVPERPSDAELDANGNPGAGSDARVYIDLSNNDKHGYRADTVQGGWAAPLWLILAHELTTGHAYHCVDGTLPHATGNQKDDEAARENQAIDSENKNRKAHDIPRRKRVAADGE